MSTLISPVPNVVRISAGRTYLLLVATLGFLLAASSAAAQARLAADAHTNSAAPTTPSGGNVVLAVSPNNSAYLAFDFSSLPAATTAVNVNKAVLMMWVSKVTTKGKVMVTRLNSAWTESTLTYNTAPALGAVEVGDISISKAKQFVAIDVTQLVKDTLDLQQPNYGLAIVPQDPGVNIAFDSKEATTTSHEPNLIVYLGAASEGDNTFVGSLAGSESAGGALNAFVGAGTGAHTTTGSSNTFLGSAAGNTNTTESANTLVGAAADIRYPNGVTPGSITNATAIGANAIVSKSNSLVLGNGVNVGIGTSTPSHKLDVVGDIRFGAGGFGCIMDRSGAVVAGQCASVPEQFVARLRLGGSYPPAGIPIQSFATGVGKTGTSSTYDRIKIERTPDQWSPRVMQDVHEGVTYLDAKLDIIRVSDGQTVLEYRFLNSRAIITQYKPGGSAPDNGMETIEVALVVIDEHSQIEIEPSTRALPADARPVAARCKFPGIALPFDVAAYDWEVTNTPPTGPTSGSGRAEPQPFRITKAVGLQSRTLWELARNGTHTASVVIEIDGADGAVATRYTLTDVVVRRLTVGGHSNDVNTPTEELFLEFTRILIERRAPDGTWVSYGWDYARNVRL